MPYPDINTMWQETRMLKARVCTLEAQMCNIPDAVAGASSASGVLQFVVGEPAGNALYTKDISIVTLPLEGEYVIEIRDNVLKDSIVMFWENAFFPMGRTDRESYGVVYGVKTVITRQPNGYPFMNAQLYTITYEYV